MSVVLIDAPIASLRSRSVDFDGTSSALLCASPDCYGPAGAPCRDGRLLYRFKRPWRDGTTCVVMEPMELLEKLSALVPAPRSHLLRYSGVLAPASKWKTL